MDQTVHHSHTQHPDKITGSCKEIPGIEKMSYPGQSAEEGFENEIHILKENIMAPDPRLVEKLIDTIAARHEEPI